MFEEPTPRGEFHHFQLVNSDGEVPFSISVLVHMNRASAEEADATPISTNEIINFHEGLKNFDGDYAKAFRRS